MPGVAVPDADAEVLRLDSVIRSGLDPRVVGLRIRAVPLMEGGHVILVRVPRSFARPHAVDYRSRFRFYSRGAAGKFEMDVAQIRSSVVGSESLAERLRSFRAERLATVAADRGPLQLRAKGVVVCHALPLSAFDTPAPQVDLGEAEREHWDLLRPGGLSGDSPRYNFDGLLRPAAWSDGTNQAYAQLFRNGAVEAADGWALADREQGTPQTIAAVAFERHVFRALAGHLALQERLGVDPPVLVMLTLLGVGGFRMTPSASRFDEGDAIDRDDLVVTEILFEDYETDHQAVAARMRPAFDAVWNACGFPGSPNYAQDGLWRGDSR